MDAAHTPRTPARNRILEAASRLFYSRGINTTGIDLIIDEAGVAKASLYNSFESKEHLVAAYLAEVRAVFERGVDAHIAQHGLDETTLFQILEHSVATGTFQGCPFQNALIELPASYLVASEVGAYRRTVREYFLAALDSGLPAPQRHAQVARLMILHDGAYVSCKAEDSLVPATIAQEWAKALVHGATQ